MNKNQRWKVKLVRRLTNKISPDVIVESTLHYSLPEDYSIMLDGFTYIEEPYRDAIMADINRHVREQFDESNFYAFELVCE